MSQSLELNLKTTSDVPEAIDKAKQAVSGFSKQVDDVNKKTAQKTKQETSNTAKQIEDIQKKFSTSFKDIFLSFLGPMALVTGAIALIGKIIEDNKKKHEDANQAAIDGTNELMSAEDRYYARKMDREKKAKETQEQAATSREDITREFLLNDPRGQAMVRKMRSGLIEPVRSYTDAVAKNKQVQDQVQKIIAEDIKKNPEKASVISEKKESNFKGPEGFSNVIGVGANPVIEAMAKQTEIALAQLSELQKISGSTPAGQGDFTKGNQSK
jgi:hypothetical protein